MSSMRPPKLATPWKVIAIAMAAFGFVYGVVGAAGQYCVTMGSCLQDVADRGLAGFDATAQLPAAICAAVFGAFVYFLYLVVYGVRRAIHRSPPEPERHAESRAPVLAVRSATRGFQSRPLLIAVALASVWAIMSVGPTKLLDDVGQLAPKDAASQPYLACKGLGGYQLEGDRCVRRFFPTDLQAIQGAMPTVDYAEPEVLCGSATLEADGLCHRRSGTDATRLTTDLLHAAQNGLLAFLAVGAALLIWPRLQKSGSSVA
jgi:hypothetical protein